MKNPLEPKIYAERHEMVMVFPPKWVCEGETCGHRWAARLKALDVNVIVATTDDVANATGLLIT